LAILKITFSGKEASSKPVTMKSLMTEADFSHKCLGVSGAIMLAGFLPKCQYVYRNIETEKQCEYTQYTCWMKLI
jgi:hypothetical protein